MTVTVALIDDHIVFRDAFRTLLASTQEFSVVAEGPDGQEVCAMFEAHRPDVVVMDVTLPGTDGLAATRELTSRHAAKVLMLSAHAVHDYVSRALIRRYRIRAQVAAGNRRPRSAENRGARRALPRSRAAGGASQLDPRSRARHAGTAGRPISARARSLRSRRARLFECVDLGALSISVKTVETHRANINRKLSVHSSTQLLRFAALRGLVSE